MNRLEGKVAIVTGAASGLGRADAEALSKAVMAKCKDAIVRYVDQEAKKAGVKPPYKEAFESWQAHTLPIIAEARARRCFG